MSGIPFIYSPNSIPNVTGWTLNPNDILPFLPTAVEAEADAQWLFGADNATLQDLISGQGLSGVPASLNAGSMVIVNAAGGGRMQSAIDEVAEQTMFLVFQKYDPADVGAIMGVWPPSGSEYGALFYSNGGGYEFTTKGFSSDYSALPGSVGEYIFVAISHSLTARRVFVGSGDQFTRSGDHSPAAGHPIGLGATGGIPVRSSGLQVAMFAVANKFMTHDEMSAVYRRAKATLADRGISVK